MLTKIGDVVSKYGISHRSLHYWEGAGILTSTRADNDYRYYDEENLLKIKQIVLLRKLRMPIPSIQEIFTSQDLSKVISVFMSLLDDTRKEAEQLNALETILRQLLNMLKDRKNIDIVYNYLNANHSAESEEIKTALKRVFFESNSKMTMDMLPDLVIDAASINLSLEQTSEAGIPELIEIIKQCYPNVEDMDTLLSYWDFEGINMADTQWYYKIMQSGQCIGAIRLAFGGMEATIIRNIAYKEPDNNIYLFELLKKQFPQTLCWMIRNTKENDKYYWNYDWEGKKQRFWEDNGFEFYNDYRNREYVKMMKPHDEVYSSTRYRFGLSDGSMDGVSFRFFGANNLDWYDGQMRDWRVTDCNFSDTIIYDTVMYGTKVYFCGLGNSDFQYVELDNCTFKGVNFTDSKLTDCNIQGMTIDGVNVEEALKFYKEHSKNEQQLEK